jgi:drug/metabolite transporter (DMT)-like permease
LKTFVFAALAVLSNVAGNAALSRGLRGAPTAAPHQFLEALIDPWVALGTGLLLLWLFSHMALLSWADLSYVLPVTSAGYALAALAGKFFFDEAVSPARWAGICLIAVGVAVVGRTPPKTTAAAGMDAGVRR